jgi:hypothetical protein
MQNSFHWASTLRRPRKLDRPEPGVDRIFANADSTVPMDLLLKRNRQKQDSCLRKKTRNQPKKGVIIKPESIAATEPTANREAAAALTYLSWGSSMRNRLHVIVMIALSLVALGLLVGCPGHGSSPSAGTITVQVTGAAAHNGEEFLCAVVVTGNDIMNPTNHVATSSGALNQKISAGTVVEVMVDTNVSPTDAKVFPAGDSYDVAGMIDVDGDKLPTTGVDYLTNPAKTVVIDGNMTLEFTYPTDFILAP